MTVRKITDLGPVGQLAYLPQDFDAAVKYWTETMGVGPFYLMENVALGEAKYKGVPTGAVFSIAIAYWGDVQIELVRPENQEPSIYTGEYAVTDQLHHICIFVDSIAEARAACAEAGAEILVEGKVGADGEVIYVDPGSGPGHVIELLQNMTGADGIFQMIKDAGKDWDGKDPLRKLG
ncbi:VOC family protein [Novosphingobium cyanobacteriorum]|jgi:catechol 2,3-dioxygenase-like lactoylglutathione lyase family enzyme|uniref:VOC family protein n=1 Tax=Novosphingobium cyanobacteriorum TaxID=3024215 RepID=A0ABT6CFF3_9SPHN|nr:VOC family protein [Novosphingobium cyanobacteriorum]MDF8332654.1 VOC family protein [Novosphingobium cyanobacteriorum]